MNYVYIYFFLSQLFSFFVFGVGSSAEQPKAVAKSFGGALGCVASPWEKQGLHASTFSSKNCSYFEEHAKHVGVTAVYSTWKM